MSLAQRFVPKPGTRVLVTAGAGGIGAAIAEAFLDAGAQVHVCDVDDAAIAAFSGRNPQAGATRADVSREEDVTQLMEEVGSRLGGLDVLINNAGIAGPTAGIEEITPAQWRQTLDVNLTGQYLVAHGAVPMLLEGRDPSLVAISSVAGRLGYAFRTPYSASKWGVVGLAESLARELGPKGVRVNAVLPGIVRGERIRRVIEDRAQALGLEYEEMERRYLEQVSLRRMVEPEDVAHMSLFLCSAAARNISGQTISVCGNVETL